MESSRKSNVPNEIDLELRFEGSIFKTTCNADTIGKLACEDVQKLNPESLIRITGQVRPPLAIEDAGNINESRINGDSVSGNSCKLSASNTTYNLSVSKLVILSKTFPNHPFFQGGELSGSGRLEERLDNRILDQRATASGAIFKLQSGMSQLIVEFLIDNGFTWLHTPRIRGSHVAGDDE
jgi:aspartyl/asparaginyl-tRNA synthetase